MRRELTVGIAPIIVSIMLVVAVSLLGLTVAWWPETPASAAPHGLGVRASAPDPDAIAADCYITPSRDTRRNNWM